MSREEGRCVVPPYTLTSSIYDRLVGVYAFEHWKENFERLCHRYGLDISICGDVACGTGLASAYLADLGAEVFAFDQSLQMLEVAAEALNGRARLLRQDMRYLEPPRKTTLLICATDSLNHLLREVDFKLAIKAFYAALHQGGYLLFDMNSAWQLREGRDSAPWDFMLDDLPIRWISEWDEIKQTAALRFIFPGLQNNRGDTFEEVHRERAYQPEWVMLVLREAGFRQLDVLDASGLGGIRENTRRYQFVARK
jgi:SAM-dependent methyltransferase